MSNFILDDEATIVSIHLNPGTKEVLLGLKVGPDTTCRYMKIAEDEIVRFAGLIGKSVSVELVLK